MKLDEKHKIWLVQAYACYKRTGQVQKEFFETFGMELAESQVRWFNMALYGSEKEAKAKNKGKWWPTHAAARQRFEASIADIPIASKAYRVAKLDEMFQLAYDRRNFKSAADLLEQAAKETGDAYSNRRIVDGKVDHDVSGTVEVEVPDDVRDVTLASHIRDAIAQALATSKLSRPETIQ